MTLPKVDLAKIVACPGCGEPTRCMGGVPIAGNGLDLVFAKDAWCDVCLKKKCDDAVDGIVPSPGRLTIVR